MPAFTLRGQDIIKLNAARMRQRSKPLGTMFRCFNPTHRGQGTAELGDNGDGEYRLMTELSQLQSVPAMTTLRSSNQRLGHHSLSVTYGSHGLRP